MTEKEQNKYKKNHKIKFTCCDIITTFWYKYLGDLCSCFCDRQQSKIWRLYEFGEKRIEEEFDIIKIIKATRNFKIFLQD